MGINHTPMSERVHIGFFGKRNAGKSSVMNAVTGQELSVVSDIRGTTTDPVYKSMELLPLGPVVMIDTPGIDDEGELGALRVRKSCQVLNKTDVAVLVIDGSRGASKEDAALLQRIRQKNIPYIIALNKVDSEGAVLPEETAEYLSENTPGALRADSSGGFQINSSGILQVSARSGRGIRELKERLAVLAETEETDRRIVGDLLAPGDVAVLVVPVDKAAPKGRLILPQQQTIRDILDADAAAVVVKEDRLRSTLESLGRKPKIVITDSQVFGKVSKDTPQDILLTSFSILFARYKGNLETVVKGVTALDTLENGGRILISEGCTHHRQCGDIGTVKLPALIQKYTGKRVCFADSENAVIAETTSGTEFPADLTKYKLVLHCGGCMLNEREMKYRLSCACDQGVPVTNYGIAIAYMNGILERSVEPFPEIKELLRRTEHGAD